MAGKQGQCNFSSAATSFPVASARFGRRRISLKSHTDPIYLGGKPDLFAQALLGYGLLQLALLLRLLPWIAKQPFGASSWAFSFGVTALAFDAIVFMLRGQTGYIEWRAMGLFVLANLTMVIFIVGTLWRLAQGKLQPPRLTAQPA